MLFIKFIILNSLRSEHPTSTNSKRIWSRSGQALINWSLMLLLVSGAVV